MWGGRLHRRKWSNQAVSRMCTEEEGEDPATETEEQLPGSKQGAESGRGVRTLGQIGLWSCVCNQNLRGQDFDPLLNFQIGV